MSLWHLLLLLGVVCVNGRLDIDISEKEKHHAALGACQACKAVVKSFKAVSCVNSAVDLFNNVFVLTDIFYKYLSFFHFA